MADVDSIETLLKEIEKMSVTMREKNYNYFKIKDEKVPKGLCFKPWIRRAS